MSTDATGRIPLGDSAATTTTPSEGRRGPTLRDLDEALFHALLSNLPADMRQERIDMLLDRRLELMADA